MHKHPRAGVFLCPYIKPIKEKCDLSFANEQKQVAMQQTIIGREKGTGGIRQMYGLGTL